MSHHPHQLNSLRNNYILDSQLISHQVFNENHAIIGEDDQGDSKSPVPTCNSQPYIDTNRNNDNNHMSCVSNEYDLRLIDGAQITEAIAQEGEDNQGIQCFKSKEDLIYVHTTNGQQNWPTIDEGSSCYVNT